MQLQTLDYPYELSTVFSAPADPNARLPLSRRPSRSQLQNGNGDAPQKLGTLVVVDYRYTRFALDPRTGLFSAVKYVSPYVSTECIVHRRAMIETGETHLGLVSTRYNMVWSPTYKGSDAHYLD